MAHLVRYRTPAGQVTTDEVADLATALARVEDLRNSGDVDDVRVFAELPLRVETVVRVSVATDDTPSDPVGDPTDRVAPPEPSGEVGVPPPPVSATIDPPPGAMLAPVRVDAPSADAEDLLDAEAGPRRGLFQRG